MKHVIGRIATAKRTSEYWNVTEGQKFTILKWSFSNGEGQLKLRDELGNVTTLPDMFFSFES